MLTLAVALAGHALHSGDLVSVVLRTADGPTAFEVRGARAPLGELSIVRADRGVEVAHASWGGSVDLVEHVLAAVGGLGLMEGLIVAVRGPELPLLDGAAWRYGRAMVQLGLRPCPRSVRVTRCAEILARGATYWFEPSSETVVEVEVEFDHPFVKETRASWHGCPQDFLDRIASARTFGFVSEGAQLRQVGRARGANTTSVIVLCDDGSTLSSPPPDPDECVRHKLLDLIGDLTLTGGVPAGRVRAFRPGHAATHEAVRWAWRSGVLQVG